MNLGQALGELHMRIHDLEDDRDRLAAEVRRLGGDPGLAQLLPLTRETIAASRESGNGMNRTHRHDQVIKLFERFEQVDSKVLMLELNVSMGNASVILSSMAAEGKLARAAPGVYALPPKVDA